MQFKNPGGLCIFKKSNYEIDSPAKNFFYNVVDWSGGQLTPAGTARVLRCAIVRGANQYMFHAQSVDFMPKIQSFRKLC